MKVGVLKETTPGEHRVALVPEMVARLRGAGLDVLVQSGAGDGAWFADSAYAEAGASIVSRSELLADAAVVVGISRPDEPVIAALRPGQALLGMLEPPRRPRVRRCAGRQGRDRDQPGRTAPHAAQGPGNGRADLPGERGRLQGGAGRGGRVRQVLPAADHRGRHGTAGQGPGARHRGGGPAGHRNGQAARRRGLGLRRAPADQDRGRVAGCHLHRADLGGGGGRRGRLRPGTHRGRAAGTAGRADRAHRPARRDHHHRPGARPPSAAAGHRGRDQGDGGRFGDRGHGGGRRSAATSRVRSPTRRR